MPNDINSGLYYNRDQFLTLSLLCVVGNINMAQVIKLWRIDIETNIASDIGLG